MTSEWIELFKVTVSEVKDHEPEPADQQQYTNLTWIILISFCKMVHVFYVGYTECNA